MGNSAQQAWTKSTKSATQDCVEWSLAQDGDHVLVRHSKRVEDGHMEFTLSEWRAFLAGVKEGEADL